MGSGRCRCLAAPTLCRRGGRCRMAAARSRPGLPPGGLSRRSAGGADGRSDPPPRRGGGKGLRSPGHAGPGHGGGDPGGGGFGRPPQPSVLRPLTTGSCRFPGRRGGAGPGRWSGVGYRRRPLPPRSKHARRAAAPGPCRRGGSMHRCGAGQRLWGSALPGRDGPPLLSV